MSVDRYCTMFVCKFEGVYQNNIGLLLLGSSGFFSELLVSKLNIFIVVGLYFSVCM